MNELLKVILSLSLSGTFFILLLLLSRPLWEKRLRKSWQYYIWLVVILRLLLPWTPEQSPVGNFFLAAQQLLKTSLPTPEAGVKPETDALPETGTEPATATGTSPETATEPETDALPETGAEPATATDTSPEAGAESGTAPEPENGLQAEMEAEGKAASETDTKPERTADPDTTRRQRLTLPPGIQLPLRFLIQNLWLIWLVTALLLFIRKITVYQSFVSFLKADCVPVTDLGQLEHFGRLAEQNRIRGSIGLYTCRLVSSPLLIGFFHPRIILTSGPLAETDFHYTILHELTHCKRLDMFYKWLVQLTICLHWFNPFVYRMEREISRACELSCDESIIRSLDSRGKRAYGDTLLNAAEVKGTYSNRLASMTLNESRELLKGRLEAIMKYKKTSGPVRILTVLFTILLAGGAFAAGSYAAPAASGDSSAAPVPASSSASPAAPSPYTADTASVLPDNDALSAASARITGLLEKDGQYFALCDNAVMEDCPSGGVTDGSLAITLVYPDRYTVIGPFSVSEPGAAKKISRLTEDVANYCEELLEKGKISPDEKDLFTAVAAQIQSEKAQSAGSAPSGTTYIYSQSGYYMAPYIFTIGWNLHESDRETYTNAEILTLNDGTALTVFFDPSCQNLMQNREAAQILTALLSDLKKEAENTSLPLLLPLVSDIRYTGNQDVYELAKQYYNDGNPLLFTAVFSKLDKETQIQYLDKSYTERNIALFTASLSKLVPEDDLLDIYAQKAYKEDSVSFFSVLIRCMGKESLQYWTEKAGADKKTAFLYVCLEAADYAD